MAVIDFIFQGVDEVSGVAGGISDSLGALGGVAGGVLTAGLAAATAATGALVVAGGLALSSAMENEVAQADLAQVLQSTAGAAGLTQEAANDLATQFMDLAGGSDDVILGIETIGLRSGQIAAKDMPGFIEAVLDLGTVMGSTEGAAQLLARAQDDPVSAFNRVQKATGAYDSELEEQIKTLTEASDKAGAVDLIMGKLAETTGGAAAARAETLSGKWSILKGHIGEALETMGGPLLTNATTLFDNVLKPAIPIVDSLAQSFSERLGAVPFESIFAAAKTALGNFLIAITPITTAARGLADAFIASMPMIQGTVQDMVNFVIAQVNILSPTLIGNITTVLTQLTAFWQTHGTTIMAVVDVAFRFIAATVGVVINNIVGVVAIGTALLNGNFALAGETWKATVAASLNAILSIVGSNLSAFIASWSGTWNLAVTIVSTIWGNIQAAISAALVSLSSTVISGLWNVIGAIGGMAGEFVSVGSNLVAGLVQGWLSGVGGLIGAVVGAVKDAIDAGNSAAGNASPSKITRMTGLNMMRGLGGGVVEGTREVVSAMQTSVKTISTVVNQNLTINSNGNPSIPLEFQRSQQRATAGAMR